MFAISILMFPGLAPWYHVETGNTKVKSCVVPSGIYTPLPRFANDNGEAGVVDEVTGAVHKAVPPSLPSHNVAILLAISVCTPSASLSVSIVISPPLAVTLNLYTAFAAFCELT
jgi:hypothetical protein